RTKDVDARSDIWAMGVVLYELVTASVPFNAQTLTEVVALVLQEEPIPPSRLRADLPAAIDALVARCLQKRPEHRFQSIAKLGAALRQTVAPAHGGASAGAPPPIAPRVASVSQPEPAQPAGALTGSAWGKTDARHRPPGARRRTVAAAVAASTMVALGAAGAW